MERFFIQIREGRTVGHPMTGDNLTSVYPHIDLDNLPSDYMPFVRTEHPEIPDPYTKAVSTYIRVGDEYTDSWSMVPMTDEEKAELIGDAKEDFRLREGPESWIWDEENCKYEPPVPYPDDFDTVPYRWNEDITNWERIDL